MTFTATLPHSFLATAGQGIDLFPVSSDLTVAEVAVLLDLSEDSVDCLLNKNALKYRQAGEQRLIDRENLLEYKRDRDHVRTGLVEMMRLNQEMGLYDN